MGTCQSVQDIKNIYPDIDLNDEGGLDSYKENFPIAERDPIVVVIKHPTENTYLIAKWKSAEWNGFLTGGIEEGDTLEQTVKKEIHEETGFKHIGKIVPMNFVSHALFLHPVKNVNRLAHYHLVYAELADLEKDDVSEEESAIADFVWVPHHEVLKILTRKGMKLLWKFYVKNK